MTSSLHTLYILHKDPFLPFSGGVEKTVLQRAEDHNWIIAYPKLDKGYYYRTDLKTESPQEVNAERPLQGWNQLFNFFNIGIIEIHHILGWAQADLLNLLTPQQNTNSIPTPKVTYFIHDYFSLCPSINLIHGAEKKFCQLNATTRSCNQCFSSFYNQSHRTLSLHREDIVSLLNQCDEISIPSETAASFFKQIFINFDKKIRISRPELNFEIQIAPPVKSNKIVFVGAFSNLKGAQIFREAIPDLIDLQLQPEVWGQTVAGQGPLSVPIRPYLDRQELKNRFNDESPLLFVIPSITAETFSFTFHESVAFSDALPIVGPWGLPAAQVKKWNYGKVMSSGTPEALISAVKSAIRDRTELIKNRPKKWDVAPPILESTPHSIKQKPNQSESKLIWQSPNFSKFNHLKYWLKKCL